VTRARNSSLMGMTDELITMLAKNPSLRVTSRTSVMQYKKAHRPPAGHSAGTRR